MALRLQFPAQSFILCSNFWFGQYRTCIHEQDVNPTVCVGTVNSSPLVQKLWFLLPNSQKIKITQQLSVRKFWFEIAKGVEFMGKIILENYKKS